MWTKELLQDTVRSRVSEYLLIVVSNRQPFLHQMKSGKIVCQRQPGGLVTALNPVMQAVHGTWIAAGSSAYDRVVLNPEGKVMLPPEDPSYALRRIFLSKEDADGYYYGFSNEGLWPLSHIAYTRPYFSASDWQAYQQVNRTFADTILEEVGNRKAFIWVHDFHLTLVGKYLKEAERPNLITSFFWHIPWPNPEVFSICPQKKEILEGLLSYDLLGFQIRYHCDNFLGAVDRELEARIDREKDSVTYQNRETLVRAFPISVDFQSIASEAVSAEVTQAAERLTDDYSLADKKVIVGVDRIDYTKGIPDKFRAFDRFLEKYPQYREKVVLFELGQVSRIHIQRYKDLNDELNALVEEINWKHSRNQWLPIVLTRTYFNYREILALYRIADACFVNSLHDGLNLVAKEFVSARSDEKGALLLSQFTGAARELPDAVLVNPYDPDATADAIYQALEMPAEEQEKRMHKMREVLATNNIYRWAGKILAQLLKFEFQEV